MKIEQINAYFARICLPETTIHRFAGGELVPSLELLKELVLFHQMNIPFENLDMHTLHAPLIQAHPATPIRFDTIWDKIINQRRGGYCFESTELLRNVLIALGFTVERYLAKVQWLKDKKTEPFHETLIVRLDQCEYLVDAGIGTATPGAPLLLSDRGSFFDRVQMLPTHQVKQFRFILDEDGDYQLQAKMDAPNDWMKEVDWKPIFAFKTDKPCTDEQVKRENCRVSATKQTPFKERLFITGLFPMREDPQTGEIFTGRITLTNVGLKKTGCPDIKVESLAHFIALLEGHFNIIIPHDVKLTPFVEAGLKAQWFDLLPDAPPTSPSILDEEALAAPAAQTLLTGFDTQASSSSWSPANSTGEEFAAGTRQKLVS